MATIAVFFLTALKSTSSSSKKCSWSRRRRQPFDVVDIDVVDIDDVVVETYLVDRNNKELVDRIVASD